MPESNASRSEKPSEIELSIVMPCLNEAETLADCIRVAQEFLNAHKVVGEVVVADNGSTDGSQRITLEAGARLAQVKARGYGSALMGGIQAAQGRYIVMGDSDKSYDFSALGPFLEELRAGSDLVMGNRFEGGIQPGAMPFHHRYLGNPLLSGIGRLFFRSPANDFHCGLRGFSRTAFDRMDLQTTGMEFASEMVIKATLLGMKIAEVPVILYPDGRSRPPHLRSFRDGWRHLRFMFMYSPRWLFLYPGIALSLLGAAVILWLLPGPRQVGEITFNIHTMLYAFASVVLGFQSVLFALFTKNFAVEEGLLPPDQKMGAFSNLFSLEKGLLVGLLMAAGGLSGSLYAFLRWGATSFGELDPSVIMRIAIPSVLVFVTGVQLTFASFFLSILRLGRR
jgi:glycosyltransferase involved in cell wall biosynthesis